MLLREADARCKVMRPKNVRQLEVLGGEEIMGTRRIDLPNQIPMEMPSTSLRRIAGTLIDGSLCSTIVGPGTGNGGRP